MKRKINEIVFIAIVIFNFCCLENVHAQKFEVSTNFIDWAELGTMNVEAGYAISRHISLGTGVKYNPFTYGEDSSRKQYKQISSSFFVKYWPWNVYSGFWSSLKFKYQQYNFGGVFSEETDEGNRYGIGLSCGYSYMLSAHLNIIFGLGFWTGKDEYTRYKCPVCGPTVKNGQRFFIRPDNLMIAISYIF